jgi:hypothetical protein
MRPDNHPVMAGCVQNKLSWRMEGYRLDLMRFRYHTFRAAMATGISVWMAVVACLIGCTLPSFANAGLVGASAIHENSGDQSQPDLMASMENCPHHSGSNAPAKRDDGKPVPRGGGMSCCPVEVTVASKPDTVILHVAMARDFVAESDFSLAAGRFVRSAEFVPLIWRSGRDRLLETRLLRI